MNPSAKEKLISISYESPNLNTHDYRQVSPTDQDSTCLYF